jgi:hypothetical protein
LDEVSTLKGKKDKVDVTEQNAKYTPPVDALGDNEPYNSTKNILKEKPWSAQLRQRHSGELIVYPECPQGPAIPSHNPPDQVKNAEFDENVVKERFRESYTKATVTGESESDVREQFKEFALLDNFEELILDLLISEDIVQ